MFLDLAGALLGRAALCGKCNRSKTKNEKRIPFTSALVELFCIPYGLISDQISVGGMGKHKGGLFYKGRNYFDLVSLLLLTPQLDMSTVLLLYGVHTVCWFCTANLRSRRKYKISLIFISILGYSYLLLMTHWSTSLSLLLNPCQPCDFVSAQAVGAIGKSWLKLTQITNSLW